MDTRAAAFASQLIIDEERYPSNLWSVVNELRADLGVGDARSKWDIVAKKLYSALKKHDPEAGERGRRLIDYIVWAELKKTANENWIISPIWASSKTSCVQQAFSLINEQSITLG